MGASSIWILGRDCRETCYLPVYWTRIGRAVGWRWCFARRWTRLGLEGTTVESVRVVEKGLDCTRVRVEDGEAAPLRRLREMEQVISGRATVLERSQAFLGGG